MAQRAQRDRCGAPHARRTDRQGPGARAAGERQARGRGGARLGSSVSEMEISDVATTSTLTPSSMKMPNTCALGAARTARPRGQARSA
jgi:hypothetical protein